MNIPDNLKYTKDHLWLRKEGEIVVCGITDYAQNELGDVVFVELPQVGTQIRVGDRMGDIESIKTVSNLYAPVSGEIREVNQELEKKPELINQSPYEEGWICKIKPANEADFDSLWGSKDYQEFIEKS
ncbi:MAG: glycine cleavage system protein [Candidatus Atribacteria bacterium]|nr:glycine cleavage system protein [Candidatus Atribacteria bacterium]